MGVTTRHDVVTVYEGDLVELLDARALDGWKVLHISSQQHPAYLERLLYTVVFIRSLP